MPADRPGPGDGGDDVRGEVRSRLEGLYARRAEALVRDDVPAAVAAVGGGWTTVTPGGAVLTPEQEEARLGSSFTGTRRPVSIRTTIESLSVADGRAVATVRELVIRRTPDTLHADHEIEGFEERGLTDTWQEDGRGWRLVESHQEVPATEGTIKPSPARPESPRIAALADAVAAGDAGALDAFWAAMAGSAPLVEEIPGDASHRLVTFLWRGDAPAGSVALAGGLPQPASKPLERVAGTDAWYWTERMPVTARTDYAFTVRGAAGAAGVAGVAGAAGLVATRADPLAARQSDWMSWFELPGAPPQPYLAERPGVARGVTTGERIHSTRLDEDRPYALHVPAGLDPADPRTGLVVVFDGEAYGSSPGAAIPTPRIVDNLVADGRIPPCVVVLVDAMGLRSRDLVAHPPFFAFVAEELVPAVRARVGLSPDPSRTVAAGSSFGGLAAATCGLLHPDVFGNVLSQSGSFWAGPGWEAHDHAPHEYRTGWLVEALAAAPVAPVRFWLEVGRFEVDAQVLTNRHLRSVLELRGYPHTYVEYDGGHSYACWRGSIADGLVALLGS